jgi:7-cyano-7-deazaguanine synthase
MKNAIILFSGGLDSTTCLAIAKEQGFACYALSFSYGQKHSIELEQAKKISRLVGVVEHRILTLPIGEYGGSALTDASINVPDHGDVSNIPSTYVPARNTIFLSFALSWGEVIGAHDIFIGANCVDYSNYPDCRPDYLQAFEKLANLATKVGQEENQAFKVHAPLLHLNKAQIILEGLRLGVDYGETISCYRADAQGHACGSCDSCIYRIKGFAEAGIKDPTIYY